MRKTLSVLLLIMGTLFCVGASAQSSSLNTFSPYTFYGLGDFSTQGSGYQRAMGGAGIAYRDAGMINQLNPAALGNVNRRSVLYSVGLEGTNMYSQTQDYNTSYNSFNIRDIALQMSVYQNMGISFSMTPLTTVGYRVETQDTDPDILVNVGQVKYTTQGEGGITQFKLGYGAGIAKGVSVGAEAIYYHGTIIRSFDATIIPTIQPTYTNSTQASFTTDISRVMFGFGVQASPIFNQKRVLTFAATYRLGGNLNPTETRLVETTSMFFDTVSYSSEKYELIMPSQLTVGLSYQEGSFGFSADYTMQDWEGLNDNDETNSIQYYNNNTFKVGASYTPNRLDIRSFFKRLTYRAGFHTGNYYLMVDNNKIKDEGITLGVGIPLKYATQTSLELGAEFGKRGTINNGLIEERYMKFSLGFNFFADDYWFVKQRYD